MGAAGQQTSETFAQYHSDWPSAVATTLLNRGNRASSSVVLWADFFSETEGEQQISLVHEFLHSFFNLGAPDHSDVIKKFGINAAGAFNNSDAIDRWIKNDCKN